MANKSKRQSQTATADAETTEQVESDSITSMDEAQKIIESDQESGPSRRLPHVAPEVFAQLRDELGLSNKQVAAAIGRTLARVSELTYSQGASIQTWERFEKDVRAYAEAHANDEPESEGDESTES